MSLRIYFLRHGETTYSKTGGFCGDLDPELTPQGVEMAEAFAAKYKSLTWSAVYTSPMRRAIATAKPLCEAIGIPMQTRDGLKEIRFGKWEGQTTDNVKQNYLEDYIAWMTEPAWNPPTEGETAVQIASRASLVMTEIERTYKDDNILVVSHKATIRIILCSLLSIDLGRYRDRLNILAGSLSIVKFDTYGPLLEVLGDRSYMPQELSAIPGN
jgi:probable phosphoglycerate mutase